MATFAMIAQNMSISRGYEDMRARLIYQARELVAEGDRMFVLTGSTLGGRRVEESIAGRGEGTLVVGMSATCPTCLENQESWLRLAAKAKRAGLKVFWVSRDTPAMMQEFAERAAIEDSVIADPDYSTYQALKLRAVPQTMVIDGDGFVRRALPGLLDVSMEEDLASAMGRLTNPLGAVPPGGGS
jgi:peroxiredoxin